MPGASTASRSARALCPQPNGPSGGASGGEFQPAGWTTPQAHDSTKRGSGQSYAANGAGNACLATLAETAGCPIPRANDSGGPQPCPNRIGGPSLPRPALLFLPDMTGWKLNPAFSLWLMVYPEEWACCGARAMQSCRR
jgi:hypothetical protein